MMTTDFEMAVELEQAVALFDDLTRKGKKLSRNQEARIYLAMTAAIRRLKPEADSDGHPMTSYDSQYFKLGPGKPRVHTPGVILSAPGFEVKISLDEIDDNTNLEIDITAATRPLMFRINGYDYGYRSADGLMYGTESSEGEE